MKEHISIFGRDVLYVRLCSYCKAAFGNKVVLVFTFHILIFEDLSQVTNNKNTSLL